MVWGVKTWLPDVAASLGAGLIIFIVASILLAVVITVDVYRYRRQRAGCIALICTGKCRPAPGRGGGGGDSENALDESEKYALHRECVNAVGLHQRCQTCFGGGLHF